MYPTVHCSTIYNGQNVEATQMSINRQMDKEVWYIYTMEYYSVIKRNIFESVLMRWINLELIIQSEISQKEKDIYRILIHICGIQKNSSEEFIYWATMKKQTKNRLMDMGRGEERLRCMERITWILTLPYVNQIAHGNVLSVSGKSNMGSVSTQRVGMGWGRRFKREGIYVYLWVIHVKLCQKTTKFCKAIILQ